MIVVACSVQRYSTKLKCSTESPLEDTARLAARMRRLLRLTGTNSFSYISCITSKATNGVTVIGQRAGGCRSTPPGLLSVESICPHLKTLCFRSHDGVHGTAGMLVMDRVSLLVSRQETNTAFFHGEPLVCSEAATS